MYYQRYLWSICNRREWPEPEYKAWQTSHGHYCIVRVNNREYTTGLPFTTHAGAQENAAAQAWMICRAFSANDGMLPGQRPGQVAPNGIQQGKRVAIGEGRRKAAVPLPALPRDEVVMSEQVERAALLSPHRLSSSSDEDGSSPFSSPRDSLRSSVGESSGSARSSMTSVEGISPKTSASNSPSNSVNNSPRNSADNSPRNSPRDSVMEMSLLDGAEPMPQYGKPAQRHSYSKRGKMCKCARGLPIKTYNRCDFCLAYLT